ncbi:hypothetical protein MKW92_050075 [Papaver armeniacum]|nr:hypothetical protein MKW92_050075 [Papaver armeniacum]
MFFAQLLRMLCLILLLSQVSCRSNPPPPTTTGRTSDKTRPGPPSPMAPGGPHV